MRPQDQRLAEYRRRVINCHRPLPARELTSGLNDLAMTHLREDFDTSHMCEIGVCTLMCMVREILLYREKYGPIEPPLPEVKRDDHIINLWEGLDEKVRQ